MKKKYFKNAIHLMSKIKQLCFYFCLIFLVQNSFGQTTLLQYDFEGSYAPNINNTAGTPGIFQSGINNIQLVNYNSCGTGSSSSLAGNSWGINNYYQIRVNTAGFANMTFSYCNSTNNININSFDVRYSTDNGATISTIGSSYVPSTAGGTTKRGFTSCSE